MVTKNVNLLLHMFWPVVRAAGHQAVLRRGQASASLSVDVHKGLSQTWELGAHLLETGDRVEFINFT